MAAKPTQIELQSGVKIAAREVPFKTEREEWNTYSLDDGTSIRLKTVVTAVYLVLDEAGEPKYKSEDEPELVVQSQNTLIARKLGSKTDDI